MAVKFLDNTGLAYFWDKIKSYITSLLSLKADNSAVVHIAGAETITGTKTFSSQLTSKVANGVAYKIINTGITKGNSTINAWTYIPFVDSSEAESNSKGRLGFVGFQYNKKAITGVLSAYDGTTATSTTQCRIAVGHDASGNWFTEAPTPAVADNSTKIATTAWARTATGNFACNAATASAVAWSGVTSKPTTIAGYGITDAKINNGTITLGSNTITPLTSHQTLPTLSRTISGSGNAITDITVSGHAITATKGSTFLTSHQSLANYVTLSDDQTISGSKSFLARPKAPSYFIKSNTTKGEAPSETIYNFLGVYDKNSIDYHQSCYSLFETALFTNKSVQTYLRALANDPNSNTFIELGCYVNPTGTGGFIYGNESMILTNSTNSAGYSTKCKTLVRGEIPSGINSYSWLCNRRDKNDNMLAGIDNYYFVNSNNNQLYNQISLIAYDPSNTTNTYQSIGVGYGPVGPYAWAPHPDSYDSDGDNIVTTQWVRRYNRIECNYSNDLSKPYCLIAKTFSRITGSYEDFNITLLIDKPYLTAGGGFGICRVSFRSNNTTTDESDCIVQWLCKTSDINENCIQAGIITTPGNSACDIYYRAFSNYETAHITVLSQSGNRYVNPNAYTGFKTFTGNDDDLLYHYASLNAGAQANWGENYTKVTSSSYNLIKENYVHSTGDEEVNGVKTFNNTMILKKSIIGGPAIYLRNFGIAKGEVPTADTFSYIYFCDKNAGGSPNYANNCLGLVEHYISPYNTVGLHIRALYNTAGSNTGTTVGAYCDMPTNYRYLTCQNIVPSTNNAFSCGDSNHKFTQVFATTGTIQTSDQRLKENILDLPETLLDAWDDVEWKQFKMKSAVEEKGVKARIHTGVIAQQIQSVFDKVDIDCSKYGFFCWDTWNDKEPIKDSSGDIVVDAVKAGDQYSIRYEEALAIEAAYQRRKNKILENRISELEKRLAKLEGIV